MILDMALRTHSCSLLRAPGRRAIVFALAFLAADTACAMGAERIARKAVPGALEGATDFVEEDRKRLERLMSSPEIQEATRSLAAALAGGMLDGMTEEQRMQRLQSITTGYIDAVSKSVAKSMKEDIGPGVTAAAQQAVDGVLGSALSPTNRRNAAAMADAVTRSAVSAMMAASGKGLREDLGPALSEVMDEDLGPALERMIAVHVGPALRDAIGDDVIPQVGEVSREVSRQIVLGAADAFRELQMRDQISGYSESFWGRLDSTLHKGLGFGTIIAWILGLVVLGLGILLARTIYIRRHIEQEQRRSERMLLGIVRGMQESRDKPDIDALLAELIQKDPDLGDERYFEAIASRMAQPTWKRRVNRPRRTA